MSPQSPEEAGFRARPEYAVPLDQALEHVEWVPEYTCGEDCPGGPHAHTIVVVGGMSLGAHICRERLREVWEERGVEVSGANAQQMGYGLTHWRENTTALGIPPARPGFHAVYVRTTKGAA